MPGEEGPRGTLVRQAGELRDARVESLRALSVLGVVVIHAMYWGSVRDPGLLDRIVAASGSVGPFLLFVGTGCLLYGPFARRDFGSGGRVCLRRYALNRATRILPVYVVALAAVLVAQHDGTGVREWLLYATFSQNFVAFPNHQVNRVLWYLVVEVHFYLALPLLAALVAAVARGSRRRAAAALGVLALASFAFYQYSWNVDPVPDPVSRFSLPAMLVFFAGGMVLPLVALSWAERRPAWLRGPLAAADSWILLAAGLVALIVLVGRTPQSPQSTVLLLAVGVLLLGSCVLPLAPGPLVRTLDARPLALVGVCSYSLYLWHDPLLRALAQSSWRPDGWVELLAVGLPLSLLVAGVSYTLIEAPFLRLRRRWAGPPAALGRPTNQDVPAASRPVTPAGAAGRRWPGRRPPARTPRAW